MSEANTTDLITKLVEKVLEDPEAGQKLAEEFGLWDVVRETIRQPLLIKAAREDVNVFIEYTVQDPETDQYAEQQWFHREWQRLISTKKRIMIVAPRGHGKTQQVAARCVWEIGRNHNIRIKIIGAKDDKAKEILGLIGDMIKNSPRVKEVFPDLEIDETRGDTKSEFFVKRSNVTMRDGTVQASGVLSAGAGGRADILICDDVVDPKNAIINPALRDQVKQVLANNWFSLVAASGKIIYIATPYHVLDATHHLKETVGDSWEVWWVPAIIYHIQYDEQGETIMVDDPEHEGRQKPLVTKELLWPEKWTEAALEAKRTELGPRAFASQFLLKAMSDEDRTFPEESLSKSYNRDLAHIGDGVEDDWPTFAGVDLASALGKRAAWTVILTLARNPMNGKLRIKEIYRRKMGFSQTLEEIIFQFKKHRWRIIYVESNQYQTAVVDSLDVNHKTIPVKAFQTGLNKNDELVGLPGLNVAFDHGLFEIPAAHFPLAPDDATDLGNLMMELQTHPGGESKDIIMALWFAYRASVEGQGDFEDAYIESIMIA